MAKMIHNVNIIIETVDDTLPSLWRMVDILTVKNFTLTETLDGSNTPLTIIIKETL